MKPGATGITRIMNATVYSMQGLKAAWQNEAAFRQESVLLLVAIAITSLLPVSLYEQVAMLACIVLVMIVELMNSAIEAVVDRIGPERHELSGRAKDIGSAAVFVAMVLTGMVWAAILYTTYLA
ncbi:diacylglycerol kinase [Photobacterium aphoticum]|uniref:Diacylglycerol kinase n=1 Tax=Photobacterium aphoticum TaxID=754436 RepID=A0A090RF15_9GAMM|nr:diacylglycerol kinase [Photobacterium aphoticum]KLU99543.1 diacylglycerol kinase [Photobacterium aphoticum]PSU57082.1 diacylglycerol kinase [Photobacterium aphoticum]GAL06157.1 diacylglycerol kinase [Photobacterium aphoticum]GHA53206.1 diacylglycerol kinase [Photobacterium aphoticum]